MNYPRDPKSLSSLSLKVRLKVATFLIINHPILSQKSIKSKLKSQMEDYEGLPTLSPPVKEFKLAKIQVNYPLRVITNSKPGGGGEGQGGGADLNGLNLARHSRIRLGLLLVFQQQVDPSQRDFHQHYHKKHPHHKTFEDEQDFAGKVFQRVKLSSFPARTTSTSQPHLLHSFTGSPLPIKFRNDGKEQLCGSCILHSFFNNLVVCTWISCFSH